RGGAPHADGVRAGRVARHPRRHAHPPHHVAGARPGPRAGKPRRAYRGRGRACVREPEAGMPAGVIGAVAVIISGMLGKIWPPAPPAAAGRGLLDRLSSRDGFYGMLLSFVLVRIAALALLADP